MRKINLDKQTVIFLVLALFLLIELVVLLPASVNRIVSLSRNIAKTKLDIEGIERDWPRKDEYDKQRLELSREIEDLRGKFIRAKEESKLLSFISGSSKDFGIEIQSIAPEALKEYPETVAGQFQYFPIRIRARGRFHNLGQFYEFLQASGYFFEATELRIQSDTPYNIIEMTLCGLIEKKPE